MASLGGAAGLTRVALLVPLSGRDAAAGQALLRAAEMAVFDAGGSDFVLQPYDTGGTPDAARQAAALAMSHGVRLMIGPLLSTSVQAVAPQARAGNVRMIAFSSDPSVAGGGVYVAGFLLREQARRVVEFALSQGLRRFAILAPDDAYGRLMAEAFDQAARRLGGEVTGSETYQRGDRDQTVAVIQRLGDYARRKAALDQQRRDLEARGDSASLQALSRLEGRETVGDLPFDALFLPEGGGKLKEMVALLNYYDIDTGQVRLLGPMLWQDPSLGHDPALVGGWFPAPPPDSHDAFARRYQRLHGAAPPAIASLGYDITLLAAALASRDGTRGFGAGALTRPAGFQGVDGLFRFLEDGTSERGFAVLEIHPGGPVLVGAAPETFQPLMPAAPADAYYGPSAAGAPAPAY
jgi:ABC-type branched-subunit amino acid transport system substrate-binding protein